MKLYALAAGAALFLTGCVVVTEDEAAVDLGTTATSEAEVAETAAETETQEAEVREERICRRERVTGSNRPRRVCYTRQQYEDMQDNARDAMGSRNNTCYNCGGDGG